MLREAFLYRVGEEGGDLGPARREGADREAEGGAAEPGFPGAAPFGPGHPDRALDGDDRPGVAAEAGGDPERFADGEEADGDGDDVDPVLELGHAEGEAALAGQGVDADEADREPEEEADEAAHDRGAEQGRDREEGKDDQREVFGLAELQGDLDHERGDQRQAERGDGAGDEGADGGGGEGGGAAAPLRHLVAFEGGDDRGGLARGVEQDRGRGAAVHAAVVDAGEHDEGADGLELVRDREKEGDGQGRADARQDADSGAQKDPEQRPEEVLGGEGGAEAAC